LGRTTREDAGVGQLTIGATMIGKRFIKVSGLMTTCKLSGWTKG
jgi:hypothetical protein